MIFSKKKNSSLLSKYQELYKKKPTSRAFAPLGETYRKLGMLDESFEILRRGIKYHPTYVLGYLVLANCYADQNKWDLVYSTILPFIEDHRDNISLQRLFAKSCLAIGENEKAVETFKFLLFINPKDESALHYINELEDKIMPQVTMDNQPAKIIREPGSPRPLFDEEDDNWVPMNFSKAEQDSKLKSIPQFKEMKIIERSLDDDYFSDDPDMSEVAIEEEHSEPVISHTLVDLYIAQGVLDKASELLEKILEAYPSDKATIEKLATVRKKITKPMEQHQELMNLVAEKIQKPKEEKIEKAFKMFLSEIKNLAHQKRQAYG
jgi:tetratricopeptide (TPR) repeat protein